MKVIKVTIRINSIKEQGIECLLSDGKENIQLIYLPAEERIISTIISNLSKVIHNNHFQFVKVMRSAIKGDFNEGQTINCVFLEGFNFLTEADFCHYIVVDRRNGKLNISTNKTELKGTHKIYADGSFACKTKRSSYGGFIEAPDGTQQIYHQTFDNGSSNLMELLAVMEGLQLLESVEKIQVNTDSRFVIRGLVQWVHFWKHNGWQTANGIEVKFVKDWQKIEQLCVGKIVEFKWIKGHSGNEKHDFCHQLANECANQ